MSVATEVSAAGAKVSPDTSSSTAFQVSVEGRTFTTSLPVDSVATYEWTPGSSGVSSWETAAGGEALGLKLSKQAPIPFGASDPSLGTLTVEPTSEHQVMAGFGGAMTESAAYVIAESHHQNEIMKQLFSGQGAHFSMVRVPLGATDFNHNKAFKSYEDTKGQFSIANDTHYLIPALEAAKREDPQLQIVATPWSAPGWMKVSKRFVTNSCKGESDDLKTEDYELYARYLARAAKAYAARGLPFKVVSLQNEPQNCSTKYPTMEMTPEDEATLSTLLHIELHSLSAPPQILGWDHNWDEEAKVKEAELTCKTIADAVFPATFPEEIFKYPNAVEDIGYHSYCGLPYEPTGLPDLGLKGNPNEGPGIYVTESTGFGPNNASGNLVYEVQHEIMDPIRDGAKASLYWNLALNSGDGPQSGGCSDCRPMVTVNSEGRATYNEDFYYWAQFSKFIRPGAVRIGSTTSGELDTVAFRNPNGSIVLVVLNGAKLPLVNAKAVSISDLDTCALLATGQLKCGGDNYSGELGDGGVESSFTPVSVSGITNAADVTIDNTAACALLSTGEVMCWGQLGAWTGGGASAWPLPVFGITNAAAVTTNGATACVLLTTRQVWCWGEGGLGQLGDGKWEDSYWMTPVTVSGITNAADLTIGEATACALLTTGQVMCWGDNDEGQLGDGTFEDSSTPVTVSGLTNAIAVSSNGATACALLATGQVKCWGEGTSGQLGDGTTANSATPVTAFGITNAIAVTVNGKTSCALLTTGQVMCWGDNDDGQIGDGTIEDSATPVTVSGITNAAAVSVGYDDACALLATGQVKCWGEGWFGELGDGTTENSATLVTVSGITNAASVTTNGVTTCSLLTTGQVKCWGNGEDGQLGDGIFYTSPPYGSSVPVLVEGL